MSKVYDSEEKSILQDNVLKYLVFISIVLSLGSYVAPMENYKPETFAYLIVTLVSLIIGAASLFFIVFAFSIYQETRNLEKLRAEIEEHDKLMLHNKEQYRVMCDEVIKEYQDFREIDRRRWKMVSIDIIQIFADILRSINDGEDPEGVEEELRRLEPLRYLLVSVTEENVGDTINALNECVTLAANPDISLSEEMFEVLIEAVDAQRMYIERDPEIANPEPLLTRLHQIRVRAQAAEGVRPGSA